MKPDQKKRWFKQGEQDLDEIRRVLPEFADGTRIPLYMPALDSVVIARDVGSHWGEIFGSTENTYITRRQYGARRKDHETRWWVTEFLTDLNPRIICSHDAWGPYAPWSTMSRPDTKLTMICFHHHREFGHGPGVIYGGLTDRHYINPLYSSSPEGTGTSSNVGVGDLQEQSAQVTNDTSRRMRENIAQTKIELLGLFSSPFMIPATEVKKTGRAARKMGGREGALAREKTFLKRASPSIKRMFEPVWRERVDIRAWDEVPPCEACGWSTAVAEEVYRV